MSHSQKKDLAKLNGQGPFFVRSGALQNMPTGI
ncbi:hypothetical protein P872_00005 [Rhodonellum psychrophilum GCM71 = DSM 17998]|uniref:Uncharacterized protein n=1 Tax=Rhodonellum psychrophilum GCM71 = DSM 17998 TaxID=1123057 RepID=U5C113_9BACT|nr:hypothetical protein P872_00005 [Rhodonellum psychrophilum GCM71 = DSM 17998]